MTYLFRFGYLLLYGKVNIISVIYLTVLKCTSGLKAKVDIRLGCADKEESMVGTDFS